MRDSLFVKVKKLDNRAVLPEYKFTGDVGMDMTAIDVEYDEEHDAYIYHTGLAFESDFGVGQFLFCRSSNSKTDCYLTNGVGIADSAIYRGEIQFRFKNRESIESVIIREMLKKVLKYSKYDYDSAYSQAKQEVLNDYRNMKYAPYKVGDRIGQMVFMRHPYVELAEFNELSDSDRGTGGFGSTGN